LISPDAWWADMNYYLSVIPYFGAMEANVAPQITLKHNPNQKVIFYSIFYSAVLFSISSRISFTNLRRIKTR